MATRDDDHILLLAGTREGLFLFDGTTARDEWHPREPVLAGMQVAHATLDPRDGRTIWAAATGDGHTAVYRSPDRGHTWERAGEPFDVTEVWHVEPGHASQPGRVWAGVKPAALWRSDDWGMTWQPVTALNEHPSRAEWWEGGAGLVLHTIVTNPADADELTVAISVAGVFRSDDGGESWQPRNRGLRDMAAMWSQEMNDGQPARHAVHTCVHKVVRHPGNPTVLFQQNHEGVYRSDDRGESWADLCDGLPDRFGFPIAVARDGSVYVVPQDSEQVRLAGQLAVYRRRDGAPHWERLTAGLPEHESVTLYREGMAADGCTPGGVYFGTSEGDIWATRDGGDHWSRLASGLPRVLSLACEHHPGD